MYTFAECVLFFVSSIIALTLWEETAVRQVRSTEEMDILLATHKANGHFVRLNYGLVPPSKAHSGIDINQSQIQSGDNIALLSKSDWQSSSCTFLKASITIGTFVIAD